MTDKSRKSLTNLSVVEYTEWRSIIRINVVRTN